MRLTDRDDLLARMVRVNRTVALPKTIDAAVAGSIDAMQRQVGEVSSSFSKVTEHVFQGPNYAKDGGQRFVIDARPTSRGFNVLTTAQATAEGLPAWNGFVSIKHGMRLLLDGWAVFDWALANPAATQPTSMGGIRRYGSDQNRTVFQLTADAQSQQVVARIALWPTQPPPRGAATAAAPEATNRLILAQDVTIETLLA